jgi:hypothetical protein
MELINQCTEAQSLEGWTLADPQNHVFTFPGFVLQPGATVKVHTGAGDNTDSDLYLGRKIPIWNSKE